VKRWGKSPPVPVVTSGAVRLMGCKAMYIPKIGVARAETREGKSEGVGR